MSNWEMERAQEKLAEAITNVLSVVHENFGEYGDKVEEEVLMRCVDKAYKKAISDYMEEHEEDGEKLFRIRVRF